MLRSLRRQRFLLGLVVVLGAAIAAPEVGRSGGPLAPERWQKFLVAAIFFVSGLELRTSELGAALRDVRLHAFVQGVSLVGSPLLFFAATRALAPLGLPDPLLEGFVVLGCLPTTITSGVAFTRACGGDEAGALFNATLGNLLGIVVTPLSILLATGHHGAVPANAVTAQLAWQVAAPVALGQLMQRLPPVRTAERAGRAGDGPWFGRATFVLLLALIYLVFCDSLSRGFDVGAGQVAAAIAIAVALHGMLLAAAFRLSALAIFRFTRPKRTTAAIVSSQKTAALGLPLLAILYRGETNLGAIALPLLIYHPLQLIVAGSTIGAWRAFNGTAKSSHAIASGDAP